MNPPEPHNPDVARLRAFNRLYTRRLGFLHDRLDASPFSLAEARVLYELAHRDEPIASEIADFLAIDPAQLSRILKQFERNGLVERRQSPRHAKHMLLMLTSSGNEAFQQLNAATNRAVGTFLAGFGQQDRSCLVEAAGLIGKLLEPDAESRNSAVLLRPPRTGDLGWVAHRQALLYAREYGWDWTYEGLASEILGQFVKSFNPVREQAWIAEVAGEIAGSIFLMATPDETVAKLRLLYVEPSARGKGVGRALVDACVTRAKAVGYRTLELWTNSLLVSARRIYEAVGFQLKEEAPHHAFGHALVGQIWALPLARAE